MESRRSNQEWSIQNQVNNPNIYHTNGDKTLSSGLLPLTTGDVLNNFQSGSVIIIPYIFVFTILKDDSTDILLVRETTQQTSQTYIMQRGQQVFTRSTTRSVVKCLFCSVRCRNCICQTRNYFVIFNNTKPSNFKIYQIRVISI